MKARGRLQPDNPAAAVMSRREGLKLLTEINKATLKAKDFTTYRALRDRVLEMRNATLPALERVLDVQEVAITQKFERDTLYVRVGSANKQKVDVVENAFKDFAVKHSYRTVLVEVCRCPRACRRARDGLVVIPSIALLPGLSSPARLVAMMY
jgi:hypothetical protein